MNKRIVFLYTELAGYIKACLDQLAASDAEVHVFAYPVNPEAPFHFDFTASEARFYERNLYSDIQLVAAVRKIDPAVIVCSGWVDSGYISVCRELNGKVRTVLALDTQADGSLRGLATRARAKWRYRKWFSDTWVPGSPQVAFVKGLGFKEENIYTGFYTADTSRWGRMRHTFRMGQFPKRFVFVGRYVDFKGVNELWQAWTQLNAPGWQLYCSGQGELYSTRPVHSGIHHLGFVQPSDFDTFVSGGGVFIMPSHREPWGVVLHEFAAAGYPLICSRNVGAATAFLKPGENGICLNTPSVEEIRQAMQRMINTPDSELIKMAEVSHKLSGEITIEKWVDTAWELLNL